MQDLIPYKSEIWLLCIVVIPDSGSCLLLVLYYSPDISVPSQYNKPHVDKDIALMLINGYWKCSDFNSDWVFLFNPSYIYCCQIAFTLICQIIHPISFRFYVGVLRRSTQFVTDTLSILASLNWSLYVICQIIILKTSTLVFVAHICD